MTQTDAKQSAAILGSHRVNHKLHMSRESCTRIVAIDQFALAKSRGGPPPTRSTLYRFFTRSRPIATDANRATQSSLVR